MGMRSWLRGRLDRFVAIETKRLFESSEEVTFLREEIERLQEELRTKGEQLAAIEERQEALGLVGFLYDDLEEEQPIDKITIQKQTCSIAGCTQEHHRDGLCREHYFAGVKSGRY